jgi:hypothetical protein
MSGKIFKIAAVAAAVYFTGGAALGAMGGGAAAGAAGAAGGAAGAAGGAGALGTAGGIMGAAQSSTALYASLGTIGQTSTGLIAGLSGSQLLSLGGLALSGLGQFQAAQAADASAEFNAKIQERNAKLATLSAQQSAEETRANTRRRVGSIRALQAKSGVVTSEGSPLLVQKEQAAEGEFEARKTLFAGSLESQSNTIRARSSRSNKSGTFANAVGAGSSILVGAGTVLR